MGLFLGVYSTVGALCDYYNEDSQPHASEVFYKEFKSNFLTYIAKKLNTNDNFFEQLMNDMESITRDNELLSL